MTVRKQAKSHLGKRLPNYRIHKASGRAFIWWNKKRNYLGPADSPESIEAYNQFIAEIVRSKGLYRPEPQTGPNSSALTIGDLMVAYLTKVQSEVSPHEFDNTRYSFRQLRKLHEHTPAERFGPKALKQIRQAMIDDGLSRKVINQRIGRIKRMFKHAVAEEMVPPSVLHALQAVEGLRMGRTEAPEMEPVKPVDDEHVDLLIPFLSIVTATMVKVERLTGMRPGEVCRMRPCDIDRIGEIWLYRPFTHKTKWRGKDRVIPIGPQAQTELQPFLDRADDEFLFKPEESYTWLREHPTPDKPPRKTKVYPSELRRREKHKQKRKLKRFLPCFTTDSYDRAIEAAIGRAGKAGVAVENWSPNQLRHRFATDVRREHGLEAVQVSLGHAKADISQVYAERDLTKAVEVARKIG